MAKKKQPDRLSRESSAAIAAGMSYGKWKSLQKPDIIVPKKPKKLIEKTCQLCGATFYQSDNRIRKYCSPECRAEADYEARRAGSKKWRAEHREEIKAYSKAWREQNDMSKV